MDNDTTPGLLCYREGTIAVSKIKAAVCEAYGLRAIDMVSDRRARPVARPRQVAMYLSRHLTPYSLPNIGRFFGDRDHTTVLHAVRQVGRLMGEDQRFKDEVETLERELVSKEHNGNAISPPNSDSDHTNGHFVYETAGA